MSRIFEDHAQEYFEYGLQPIPTKPFEKACLISGYNVDFYENKLTQEKLDKYINDYGHWDLGLVCGEMSGVIGIDFDFVGFKDSELLEAMLIGGLPPTPAIKKGAKGWTRFYKYNDIFSSSRNLKRFVVEKDRDEAFLDILSNKKITIMPPSRHKEGSNIVYEWIGTQHLFDCLEDLPELTVDHLEHIEMVWKFDPDNVPEEIKEVKKKGESRHGRVFGFILKQSNYAKDIVELSSKTLEYDQLVNSSDPKGPYFLDTKNIKRQLPEEACRHFIERVCDWKSRTLKEKGIEWAIGKSSTSYWVNVGDEEKPKWVRSENYTDFAKFFALKYPTARKDLMSAVVHYKDNYANWVPVENELESLKSFAHEVGLNQNHVKTNLDRWCLTQKKRPLFDIKPWDGVDHIGNAVSFIKFKGFNEQIISDLFKDWFAGIFRRLKDPSKANRLLILRGEQGKGKDWWVNHMLSGFGHQHGEISINPKNKIENFNTLYGLITGYISEFDETKGVPIGMLKSLITSRSAMFRLPYDKRAMNRTLHYSLIASVNMDDVLRDTTGNRRFMIFDIDEIDWTYKEKINPQKILDHAYHLYRTDFKTSDESETVMKQLLVEETPVDNETLFVEELTYLIKDIQENWNAHRAECERAGSMTPSSRAFFDKKARITYPFLSEKLEKIARKYGFKPGRWTKILTKYGFRDKDRDGVFYKLPEKRRNLN